MALLDGEFTIYQQILWMKNVSQIGREKFKKKCILFCAAHSLLSQTNIPHNTEKQNKKKYPYPYLWGKETFNYQPNDKSINSGEPNLDFKNKYHYITYLTPIQSKEGLLEPP